MQQDNCTPCRVIRCLQSLSEILFYSETTNPIEIRPSTFLLRNAPLLSHLVILYHDSTLRIRNNPIIVRRPSLMSPPPVLKSKRTVILCWCSCPLQLSICTKERFNDLRSILLLCPFLSVTLNTLLPRCEVLNFMANVLFVFWNLLRVISELVELTRI